MIYKIIEGSRLDLAEDTKKDPRFQMIPPTLQIGSTQAVDDKTSDQKRLIEMVKVCPECPKTACPLSGTFKTASEEAEAEAVFVITLSSHFSGSYNPAAVVKKLHGEEMAEKGMAEQTKKMAVISSPSTSSGELNTIPFIQNLCDPGLGFNEVVGKILAYRGDMDAHSVLESLGTLRKNERLSGLRAFFTIAFDIKLVMGVSTGTIIEPDQARGTNEALQGICDIAAKEVTDAASRTAVVCHVNSPERAGYIEDELARRVGFKKIVATNVAGVVTVYTNDGGTTLTVRCPSGEVL